MHSADFNKDVRIELQQAARSHFDEGCDPTRKFVQNCDAILIRAEKSAHCCLNILLQIGHLHSF